MDKNVSNAVVPNTTAFFSLINHPVKFRLYLLKKLPAAFFSGIRVAEADALAATVVVPYKWFTQNPFRSTYFACLSMAAEMSSGLLAMAHIYKQQPAVSMLVVSMEAKFHKKATDKTFFHCKDGGLISQAISNAIHQKQPQEQVTHSVGTNTAGDTIAEFWITWSFKVK